MMKKSLVKKYLLFILGLYFLSAGIVLIVHSNLGSTPISSINYVLSLNTSLTLGTWTFLINNLMVLGQLWLVRDCYTKKEIVEILLQVPFSFIFSSFIDLNMFLIHGLNPSDYLMSICVLLIGCVIQSIGIILELRPNVVIMSAEGFVKYASRRYGKKFSRMKVGFDVALVVTASVVSWCFVQRVDGVREGTLIAAAITGFIVGFLDTKIFTQKNWQRAKHAKNYAMSHVAYSRR